MKAAVFMALPAFSMLLLCQHIEGYRCISEIVFFGTIGKHHFKEVTAVLTAVVNFFYVHHRIW